MTPLLVFNWDILSHKCETQGDGQKRKAKNKSAKKKKT